MTRALINRIEFINKEYQTSNTSCKGTDISLINTNEVSKTDLQNTIIGVIISKIQSDTNKIPEDLQKDNDKTETIKDEPDMNRGDNTSSRCGETKKLDVITESVDINESFSKESNTTLSKEVLDDDEKFIVNIEYKDVSKSTEVTKSVPFKKEEKELEKEKIHDVQKTEILEASETLCHSVIEKLFKQEDHPGETAVTEGQLKQKEERWCLRYSEPYFLPGYISLNNDHHFEDLEDRHSYFQLYHETERYRQLFDPYASPSCTAIEITTMHLLAEYYRYFHGVPSDYFYYKIQAIKQTSNEKEFIRIIKNYILHNISGPGNSYFGRFGESENDVIKEEFMKLLWMVQSMCV